MKTRNKILALAISSVLSQAAFAEAGDQAPCNSTDALTGWGIWCTEGVKPATAAGPAPSITVAQNIPADIGGSDDFGGKTEDNGLPIVVGDERVYYRAAYDSATTYSYGYKWVYENGQYTYPEEDNFNAEGGTASAKGIGTAELNPTDANPGGDLQSGYRDSVYRTYYHEDDRIQGSFADRNGNQIASFDYFNAEGGNEEQARISEESSNTYEYNSAHVATETDHGQDYYQGYKDKETETRTNDSGNLYSETYSGTYSELEASEQENGESVLKDYWAGYAESAEYQGSYESGYDDNYNSYQSSSSGSEEGTDHAFVGGALTSPEFIAGQVTNQTVAGTYNGYSAFHHQDVAIEVNFTERSFEGSWTDGNNYHDVASHDFVASGDLVGQHIVATSITGDGVTGGTLQGSFFGDEAQALGGAYEVNTTSNTFNDVFSTVEVGDTSPSNHYK